MVQSGNRPCLYLHMTLLTQWSHAAQFAAGRRDSLQSTAWWHVHASCDCCAAMWKYHTSIALSITVTDARYQVQFVNIEWLRGHASTGETVHWKRGCTMIWKTKLLWFSIFHIQVHLWMSLNWSTSIHQNPAKRATKASALSIKMFLLDGICKDCVLH